MRQSVADRRHALFGEFVGLEDELELLSLRIALHGLCYADRRFHAGAELAFGEGHRTLDVFRLRLQVKDVDERRGIADVAGNLAAGKRHVADSACRKAHRWHARHLEAALQKFDRGRRIPFQAARRPALEHAVAEDDRRAAETVDAAVFERAFREKL